MEDQPQGQGQQLQQVLGQMSQRLGNLELTVNALLMLLDEDGAIDREELQDKAQELVQEMQEEQEGAVEEHDHQ